MCDYKIYRENEVVQVEKDNLEEDALFDIFLLHPERTVYITTCGKVEGIITFGDFKRYIRGKKEMGFVSVSNREKRELINVNFTFSTVEEERNITALFEAKKSVLSIPVLDGQGKILREYHKEKPAVKNKFNTVQFLLQIYKETYLIRNNAYIILGEWNEEIANIAERLGNRNRSIHIVNNIPVGELRQLKQQKEHFIYDFRLGFTAVVPYFYCKYGLDYFYLTDEIIHMLENIENLFAHYESVGVLDSNYFFKNRAAANIQTLQSGEFKWNHQYSCYEYKDIEEKKRPEIIYTIFPLSENPYIKWGTFFIPVCAMLGVDLNITYNSERVFQINDSDIAFNIVPKLEGYGVKCIVIDDVQARYTGWEERLGIDPQQAAGIICFNSRFEEIDQQNRWGVVFKNGYTQLQDVNRDDVTFRFGERCPDDIDQELSTMYLFGPCIVWGGYVSDHESIGYLLRKKIGNKMNVRACGNGWNTIHYVIREKEFKSGDIVIIFAGDRQVYDFNHIPILNIMDALKEVPNIKYHIRDLPYHCDADVTRAVAEKIFSVCVEEGYLQKDNDSTINDEIGFGIHRVRQIEVPSGLKQWLHSVEDRRALDAKKSGAIVMNCNPFTRGHRYLIEESAKKVDVLYIFVVEENKSYFRFEDRIKMVQLGVSDLKNVVVIPSGKYIISSETLPGYFEKDVNNDLELDATQDLDLFGGVIAKAFDIIVRFAGDEPEDAVTRQYNQQMKAILPKYGVEFVEIPRKAIGEKVISASSVRKHMKSRDYEAVRELVLPQVYDYLKNHYFHI